MANRGETWDPQVHTISDLKELGCKRLPKMYRDYFNEGAMDLITLHDNEEAYNRYKIIPRILVNVDNVDLTSSIFGIKTSLPLGFSPAAMHRLAHPDGELATSRAAAKMNICMALSSYATESLENVAAQSRGNPCFNGLKASAGYKAIFLSVDTPLLGRRLNEYRNNFVLPDDMSWPNLLSDGKSELSGKRSEISGESRHDFDPSLDWDTAIPWIREHTSLQLWLKGVYTPEDVTMALRYGLDGVVISNHGGRQLDGAPATLDALRICAPAAAGKIPIAVDGGIRRGTDIFKALALGASHCFVGRIPIWGLAYNGQEGVELALKILTYEFKIAMSLAGKHSSRQSPDSHHARFQQSQTVSRQFSAKLELIMAPRQKLQGIMVALITPFTEDRSNPDLQALDEHVNRLIDAGVHGLVPGGSTGEFTALSTEERKAVLEQVITSARGRVPVIAGIGDLSTAKVVDLAKHAADAGAAATMVVPPFYDSPNLEELRSLLKEVYDISSLPILYYNIPSASGVSLTPSEIASLSEVGVSYMKDTSGNAPALTELLFSQDITERLTTFNGWDTLTFYGLAAGAQGSVWGATNIIPELSVQLWDAVAVKKDLELGRELWRKIFPICQLLEDGNYAAAVKTGMELRGWRTGGLRKPFSLCEGERRKKLGAALEASGHKIAK
ncbi:Oxidase FUB9 [Paramyrothecium foliicola]|nr:Oxidase FUB9 [Paramyrothecium foliicola]